MSADDGSAPTLNLRAALADVASTDVFRIEQDAVLSRCWSVLGLTADIEKPGDWIVSRLGAWEVCVQNFDGQVRGFKNYCAHRFFPLRTGPKGNGPLQCSFHGWRYDVEGRAAMVPRAEEMFARSCEGLNRRLVPIDVAVRGPLIFGRLKPRGSQPTQDIDTFLGAIAPFLDGLGNVDLTPMGEIEKEIRANWKIVYKLAVDDYHIVAVHPRTLGRYGGLRSGQFLYQRFGLHSALFSQADAGAESRRVTVDDLDVFLGEIAQGGLPDDHGIFLSLFPSTIVTLTGGVFCVNRLSPVDASTTRQKVWVFRATPRGVAVEASGFRFAMAFSERVFDEDKAVAETMQRNSGLGFGDGLLGAHEERISWFNDAYLTSLSAPNNRIGAHVSTTRRAAAEVPITV